MSYGAWRRMAMSAEASDPASRAESSRPRRKDLEGSGFERMSPFRCCETVPEAWLYFAECTLRTARHEQL